MIGELPLALPILFSVMALAILAFGAGLLLSWRDMHRQTRSQLDAARDQMLLAVDHGHARIAALIEQHAQTQHTGQQDIARNVEAMQADLEWMAGEKMIEQALDMVRDNMPVARISQETGLGADTIRTLATFRAH